MKHGSKYHRRPGSLGAKGPARVFLGRKMPGRLGGAQVTVQKLLVVKVDPERIIIVKRRCSRTEKEPSNHQEFCEGLKRNLMGKEELLMPKVALYNTKGAQVAKSN